MHAGACKGCKPTFPLLLMAYYTSNTPEGADMRQQSYNILYIFSERDVITQHTTQQDDVANLSTVADGDYIAVQCTIDGPDRSAFTGALCAGGGG